MDLALPIDAGDLVLRPLHAHRGRGAHRALRAGHVAQLAIVVRAADEVIGDCGVSIAPGEEQAQLGITLDPGRRGAGHATAVVRAPPNVLFGTGGLNRVTCSADPENRRSIALFERTGFRREGLFLESPRFKGRWADDVVYAMLRREWPASR